MGYLTKRGALVKNWKKRYFVVNPDYSVDYFENEEVCEFFIIYCECIYFVWRTELSVYYIL